MAPGSADFHKVFSRAPPNIIDNRPETDMVFLEWLRAREVSLEPLIAQDVADRRLAEGPAILASLRNRLSRLQRDVLCELLHRGLHLHRFAQKYNHIMEPRANVTPSLLVEQA